MKKILMPHEVLEYGGNEDFYPALYWRYFPIVRKSRNFNLNGKCGRLCSMRFASYRSKAHASEEKVFFYDNLLSILDAAQFINESKYVSLNIVRSEKINSLFALAMFENEVGVEVELNEALPETMPDMAFLKANFDAGCVTNMPILGYLNQEGLLKADENGMQMICKDSISGDSASGPYEWMKQRFMLDAERGEAFSGALNIKEIASLIAGSI